jgi:PAS domain S-box-containing protein
MKKLKGKKNKNINMADQMVLISIFLAILYWGLESFLNVFSPEDISFYRELFGPNVSDVWMRLIVLCLFLIFGSHVQFTINKRKEIEQALKESEEKYRTILESIEEGYYEVDFDSNFKFVNDSMSRILRYPKKEVVNVNYRKFMDEKNARIVVDTFEQCRRSGKPVKAFDCEFNVRGLTLFIQSSVSLLRNSNNEPSGFHGMVRDLTEKKKLEMNLLESYRKLHNARSATILGLAKLAEYRDEGTGTHLERIREYAKMIAEELARNGKYRQEITPEYIDDIYQSSILHDIGKVGIPDAVLLKPAKLTDEEFDVIKHHTEFGGDAIRAIESQIEGRSFLSLGKEIAYNHHEKWDGSGYPKGLKGEDIPLSARIVALADVYDALTTQRFYKPAYSHEKSKQIIISLNATHFDPRVVDVFLHLEDEFNRVREEKLKEEIELIAQPAQAVANYAGEIGFPG